MLLNFDPQFTTAANLLANVVHISDKDSTTQKQYGTAKGIVTRFSTTLDRDYLSKFDKLEFVATVTTGTDHIDEAYCKNHGIRIISLKGQTEFLERIHATPEHTWGLLLSLIRNIPQAFDSVLEGQWTGSEFLGQELYEKCFGVIGFGRVGKILARYALAFGMNVVAYNLPKFEETDYGVEQVSLDRLLKVSDVVSINLSLDPTTTHFLRREHFEAMKETALLLNTSRGVIIDQADLLYALQNRQIAGAAIDVIENENTAGVISEAHPLISFAKTNRNLLITPHIAGSTHESMEKTALFIADEIKRFIPTRLS